MRIIHLPIDLDRNIAMPTNAFYIGSGIVNLPQSPLYNALALDECQYKGWLWKQIKGKSSVYQELTTIKQALINTNDVVLVCSCGQPSSCHHSATIRKALAYLIQQDRGSDSSKLTWIEFVDKFSASSVNEDSLYSFSCWLYSNNYLEEQLSFNELWLEFVQININC